MKKFTIISLILVAVLLSSCNYPGYESDSSSEPDDAMATEISRILTGTPIQVDEEPTPSEEIEETDSPDQTEEPEQETAEPEEPEEPEETEVTETVEPEETEAETTEPEEETATVTPTPTMTPTTTPTETLAETDPVLTLGDSDWVDEMNNGTHWPTGFNEYTSISFDDGYLKMAADTELDGWRFTWPLIADSYLEATLQSPNCEGNDHFGVMFRSPKDADANKGYLFGITCDGRFSLRRWNGQTMFYPVDWTASDAIKTGENEINKLGIMAEGENLTLYINGQKVKEVTDDAYLAGNFGIFVGGTNVEDVAVWVDQIRYWTIP